MPNPDLDLPPRLLRQLERWLDRWGTPALAEELRIEFSPRLRRAFGRCYQDERLIRLTPSLAGSQSHLLAEILCHEAAHAAVYERHGSEARPHGAEWEEMMRLAGFEPRVRIPVAVRPERRGGAEERLVFLHRCPVCAGSRRAARPMHRWRCRTCVDTRSRGRLEIRRETGDTATLRKTAMTLPRQRRRAAAGIGDATGTVRRATKRRAARSRAR